MLPFAQDVTYRVHITPHHIISFLIALVKDTYIYTYTYMRAHTHTQTHIHTYVAEKSH